MMPSRDAFYSIHPIAVGIREWIKKEKPEIYHEMIKGVEIGFQHLAKNFRKINKNY